MTIFHIPRIACGLDVTVDGESVQVVSILQRQGIVPSSYLSTNGYFATVLKLSDGRTTVALLGGKP